jgi:release factor glutamine methyltransferase
MASRQTTKILSAQKLLTKNKGQLEVKELEALLALAWHKNIEYLYKHPEKVLARSTIEAFDHLLKKRLANWSLAYLQGYKEFYGLKFLVTKETLIPRPESELLVDEALKYLKTTKNPNIVDIGTGTGCLILSIAKNYVGEANWLATDLSSPALKIAQTNARKIGSKNKVKFLKSNLLNKVPAQKFDLIIANLPYLTPRELKEPSIKKEPRLALWGGREGLDYYQKLFLQLPNYLASKYLILLEINPEQEKNITLIIKKSLPQAKIEWLKDLAGHVRVVKIF